MSLVAMFYTIYTIIQKFGFIIIIIIIFINYTFTQRGHFLK